MPRADEHPVEPKELDRQLRILRACWDAFDRIAAAASGVPLAKGPRGGGRDLDKIRAHVREAEAAYLGRLGGKVAGRERADAEAVRSAFSAAAVARARGEVPDQGPRGGLRWPAPYAIRRAAWHVLDHAWEIEDRAGS